jgi:hypothetical protein
MFPEVILDVGGAKDHVCKYVKLKSYTRSVKSGLPWQLPNVMVRDLVAYSVSQRPQSIRTRVQEYFSLV